MHVTCMTLGPLLFLVYVNDLPTAITASQLLMFADDTKCFSGISSALDPITLHDLNAITSWCTVNKLSLNEAKCVYLRFFPHLTSCEHSYTLNNRPIQSSNSHRDLGVILTSDLSFSSHIQKITSKAYKILGLVRRTFHCPSTTARLRLYTSLIRSQLTYCSIIWRPYLLKDIISLEKVQKRATKFILNDYTSNYKHRLISLHLLPLMYFYELQDILFFIKNLQQPSDSFKILNYISFSHSTTRASANYIN